MRSSKYEMDGVRRKVWNVVIMVIRGWGRVIEAIGMAEWKIR